MAIAVTDESRGRPGDLFTLDVVDSEAGSSRLRADGVPDWRGGGMLEALLIGVGPPLRGVLTAAELDRVLHIVEPPAPPGRSESRRTERAAS